MKQDFQFSWTTCKTQAYAEEFHRKCILPTLHQTTPHQGIEANKSITRQLIKAKNKNKECAKRPTEFNLQNTNRKRNLTKWEKIRPKIFTPLSRT
jgi:hypothetical protein